MRGDGDGRRRTRHLCHDLRRGRHTGTQTGKAITPVVHTDAREFDEIRPSLVARALLLSRSRLRAHGLE
jgi:hypothetical protein